MTVLDTLNFVAFNPLSNNNPIAVRRRKEKKILQFGGDFFIHGHKDGLGYQSLQIAKNNIDWQSD